MDRDAYGLPGIAALDSPYGLQARRPVTPIQPPMPIAPAPIAPTPMSVAPVFEPLGTVGRMLPPNNVLPFRATDPPPSGASDAPAVGKAITVDELIALQRKAESSGNYQALNKEKKGNTASGAYQYTDRTWNNYGGYPKAMLAPREVQDRRFSEDIARRVNKYNGDVFKAIADHYLPAQANSPSTWNKPSVITIGKRTVTVPPVANYVRHVLKGTPYLEQLDAYLKQQ